jgi:hypothetical protein
MLIARARGPQQAKAIENEVQDEEQTGRDDLGLLCANCGQTITRREHRVSRGGSHQHTFTNPHGLVFDIGCFSEAPGCVQEGEATLEWTWFDGFRWRVALCAQCHTHLGWGYHADGGEGFYGLILERIVAPS